MPTCTASMAKPWETVTAATRGAELELEFESLARSAVEVIGVITGVTACDMYRSH